MINPDAKPGKSSRRRAGSMEAKLLEKKRGRVKKKLAELHAAGISPTGISADGTGDFGFETFVEFRPRSDSNLSNYSVSSIGTGRLSPQLEELENEFDAYMPGQAVPEMYPDLVDSIDQSLSIGSGLGGDFQQQSFMNGHHVQFGNMNGPSTISPMKNSNGGPPQHSPMRGAGVQAAPLHLTAVPASGYLISQQQPQQISPVPPQQMYVKPEESSIPPPAYQDLYPVNHMAPPQQRGGGPMLREALSTSPAPPQKSCASAAISAVYLVNQGGLMAPAGVGVPPGTVMYQNGDFGGMIYGPPMTTLPSELSDIKYEQMNRQDLIQCNIDDVIRHELQVEGKIDFNSDAFRGL